MATVAARRERSKVDKFEARRDEIALATLDIFAGRSVAQTSLRDIADQAGFSHGVLHYYFESKNELLTHCVRQYKQICVRRYATLLDGATEESDILDGLISALTATAREDAEQQRLWYELRIQSMYEPSLRPAVDAIDSELAELISTILLRLADSRGAALAVDAQTAYSALDGILAAAVQHTLAGRPVDLAAQVRTLCDRIIEVGA